MQIRTWSPKKWSEFSQSYTKKGNKRDKNPNSCIPGVLPVHHAASLHVLLFPLILVFCLRLSDLPAYWGPSVTSQPGTGAGFPAWGRLLCYLLLYLLQSCCFSLENLSQFTVLLSKVKLFYEGPSFPPKYKLPERRNMSLLLLFFTVRSLVPSTENLTKYLLNE